MESEVVSSTQRPSAGRTWTMRFMGARHREAARLLAMGKRPIDVARAMGAKPQVVARWMAQPLFQKAVKDYESVRDEAVGTTLTEVAMSTEVGEPGPNAKARAILRAAEIPAVQAITGRLSAVEKNDRARYEAAKEVLNLLGYNSAGKSAQIVIQINAADIAEFEAGRKMVEIPDARRIPIEGPRP